MGYIFTIDSLNRQTGVFPQLKLHSSIITVCALLLAGLSTALSQTSLVPSGSKAWRSFPPASAPQVERDGSLRFSIPFKKDIDRVYWQADRPMDLSGVTSFTLDVACEQPGALRSLMLYLKSGSGWYVWAKPIAGPGRRQIRIVKSAFNSEGNPTGWHKIEAVRLSPWKGDSVNTDLKLYGLTAAQDPVFIVQGTRSIDSEQERSAAKHVTNRISTWLDRIGIPHGVLTDEAVTDQALSGARLLILGYNYVLPAAERAVLERFVKRGGKILVCFSKDPHLASMLGFKLKDILRSDAPGRWAGMLFPQATDWALPKTVYQDSWALRPAYPASSDAKVIAYWQDHHGTVSKTPAWTASSKGAWMSHILLGDDSARKQEMMLGLIAHYYPSAWQHAARISAVEAGRIDSFTGLADCVSGLQAAARRSPNRDRILQLTAAGERMVQVGHDDLRAERYQQAVLRYRNARNLLTQAYGLAQEPLRGELAGIWDHEGLGWYPGDWDRSAKELKAAGMNAVFANLLWGGLAHYPSKVLPPSDTHRIYGDQARQFTEAARRHGLESHVWLVCWNLRTAPADFVARMKIEGRLQMDAKGQTRPWLNPADPRNQDLMIRAMKEIATNYPIDGFHLDYIRYPDSNSCFSPVSRKRFEAWRGKPVPNWPRDAAPGGALASSYRRFRAEQINLFVRTAYRALKEVRPKAELSAAVFGKYPSCVEAVGQDWKAWLDGNYIDFLCPMNYASQLPTFKRLVSDQFATRAHRDRIYPGIGVTASESQLTSDGVIEQILAGRQLGARGFVLFDLNRTTRDEILPILQLGITREP